MRIKIILLLVLINIMCFAQLIKHEYFGMYKYRFDDIKWKVTKIDTHWVSKNDHTYMGETWYFATNSYDSTKIIGKELRYFFHGGQKLTAIQFILFSYDSLFILETVKQFAAIIRQEGAKGFNPDLVNGGSWPGVGGPTTSLYKVFRFEIQGKSKTYFPAFHGTLVVDFAYHYYSIVQQWETGIEPYWVSLNYYPYSTWTLNIPPDPGYGLIVPNKINVIDIIYIH